jgi:hypothetical protein
MKNILLLILLLTFGAINLSVTRAERLEGRWQAYKLIRAGKTEVFEDGKSKRAPWIEFKENNRVWVGEGKRNERRGEWWLDDDNKTIHLILKKREELMIIKRLLKKRMITQFKDRRNSMKVFWKKVP